MIVLIRLTLQGGGMGEDTSKKQIARGDLLLKPKPKVSPPSKYVVILLNDDFTPMDFVVKIIVEFFGFDESSAAMLMMQIHVQGSARMGLFDKAIAETLCFKVTEYSETCGHPLRCIYERETE
jgi:ATP-dependent Clp protease adaptor protein ClpS